MIEESAEGHQTLFSSSRQETTLSLMHAAEILFEAKEAACSFISATKGDTTMTTDCFSTPLSKSTCSSRVLQLSNSVKIFSRVASEREQEATSETHNLSSDYALPTISHMLLAVAITDKC